MDDKNNREISQKRIIKELMAIAYSSPSDFIEADGDGMRFKSVAKWKKSAGAVRSVQFDADTGEVLGIDLHAKEKALDLLARFSGLTQELNTAFAALWKYGYEIEQMPEGGYTIRDMQASENNDEYGILAKLEKIGYRIDVNADGSYRLTPPD